MEQILMEYLANSIWQVPLLAVGAWIILRALRPSSAAQYRVWLAVLPLMLAMPLLTLRAPLSKLAGAPRASGPITEETSTEPATLATNIPVNDSASTEGQQAYETAEIEHEQSTASLAAPEPAPQPIDLQAPTPARSRTWSMMHELTLTPSATHWLVGLYLAVIALMTLGLFGSVWAAWRLIAQAVPATLSDAASQQLDRCCERFAVSRPQVLLSSRASSPMLVGAVRPSLLLPVAFATRLTNPTPNPNPELEAIWLHELSHLRRRDHLTNLLCRIAALPIAYHPAAHAVQQRIRQTREMVCDEMAAAEMQSPLSYARCLVGLARTMHGMTPSIETVGMFDNGILEERIMQLTRSKTVVNARTRIIRVAASAALMLAVMAAPAMFHVTPTLAQTAVSVAPVVVTAPAVTAEPAVEPEAVAQPAQQPHELARATPIKVHFAAVQPTESADSIKVIPVLPGTPVRLYIAAVQPAESADPIRVTVETKEADARTKADTAESTAKLDDARKRLDEAAKAYTDLAAKSATDATADATQRLNDARKQLAEANRAWNQQVARTVTSSMREKEFRIDTAELNKRIAETQARINSPEFRKRIEDAQAKINSPEFKEKMQKLTQQIAEEQAKLNSPEFKAKLEKLNSPEFKKQMEQMHFPVQFRLDSSELGHLNTLNDTLSKQLDEVRQQIDDALRLWSANAPNR